MRYKKTLVLVIAMLLVFSFAYSAKKPMKLRRVGTCPLVKAEKGSIADADQLKALLEEKTEYVKKGFETLEVGFLFPAFMEQLKSTPVEEKVLPKGQAFMWMLFCKGKVAKDLVWAGRDTLPVFSFTVQHDCKDYEMVVPKKCGNISLIAIRHSQPVCDLKVSPEKANIGDPITIDVSGSKCATKYAVEIYHPKGTLLEKKELTAGNTQWVTKFNEPGDYFVDSEAFNPDGVASANKCKAKVYINYPPVCDLKVEPAEGYTGQTFKLDASGSTDKDGEVVKAEFTIMKDGQEVEKKEITSKPLVWEKVFKESGIYKIYLKVTDDFNAVSSNKCEFEIKVQKRFYGLLEGGPMIAKGTYSGYVFARGGVFYWLAPEQFSLVVSAGGALNLGGDRFKSHFMGNLLLNGHFDAFFLGGGVGFSSKVRDDDWGSGVDIVGNLGFDVFQGFNKRASIFGEIRVPMREDLEFKHGHAFLLGFRYIF